MEHLAMGGAGRGVAYFDPSKPPPVVGKPSADALVCIFCKKEGHVGRDCPEKQRSMKCGQCGQIGHATSRCLEKQAIPFPSREALFDAPERRTSRNDARRDVGQNSGQYRNEIRLHHAGLGRESPPVLVLGDVPDVESKVFVREERRGSADNPDKESNEPETNRRPGKCGTCGHKGHRKRDCTRRKRGRGANGGVRDQRQDVVHAQAEGADVAVVAEIKRGIRCFKCYNCGEEGHMSKDCPKKCKEDVGYGSVSQVYTGGDTGNWPTGVAHLERERDLSTVRCHTCGEYGHFKRACPKYGADLTPSHYGARSGPVQCHFCGEEGHIKRHCPKADLNRPVAGAYGGYSGQLAENELLGRNRGGASGFPPTNVAVVTDDGFSTPFGSQPSAAAGPLIDYQHLPKQRQFRNTSFNQGIGANDYQRHAVVPRFSEMETFPSHRSPEPEHAPPTNAVEAASETVASQIGLSAGRDGATEAVVGADVETEKQPAESLGIIYEIMTVARCAKVITLHRLLAQSRQNYKQETSCECEFFSKCTCTKKVVVFVNSVHNAERARIYLSAYGIGVVTFHNKMNDRECKRELSKFTYGRYHILILLDSEAARCAEAIEDASWIVYMDLPMKMDEFSARVGLVNKEEKAVRFTLFYDPPINYPLADGLAKMLEESGQPVPVVLTKRVEICTKGEGESEGKCRDA